MDPVPSQVLTKTLTIAAAVALLAACGPVIDAGPDKDDPDSSTYATPRLNAVPRPTVPEATTLNRPTGQRPTRTVTPTQLPSTLRPTKTPTRTFTPTKKPGIGRLVDIVRVIDGDNVVLKDGRHVRVTGIDTPERGQKGYKEAKGRLQDMVANAPGKTVLTLSQAAPDRYGRVIGYLDLDGTDAGLQLIKEGFAKARYDGLDGYQRHERQDAYRNTASSR